MADEGYIRGAGGGADFDRRRVTRVTLAVAVVAVVSVVVGLTLAAAGTNRRATRLRDDGVPVQATVASCLGIGSGIAQAVNYYRCQATYTLRGHTYTEVLGGNRANLPPGYRLAAVAVPGDPTLFSTAAGAAGEHASLTPYLAPIILGAAALAGGIGLAWWGRARRRGRPTARAEPTN